MSPWLSLLLLVALVGGVLAFALRRREPPGRDAAAWWPGESTDFVRSTLQAPPRAEDRGDGTGARRD